MTPEGRRLQPVYGDRLADLSLRRDVLLAFGDAGCPDWQRLEGRLMTWHAIHSVQCLLLHVDLGANETLSRDFGVRGLCLMGFRDGRLLGICDRPHAEGALDALLVQIVQPSIKN